MARLNTIKFKYFDLKGGYQTSQHNSITSETE